MASRAIVLICGTLLLPTALSAGQDALGPSSPSSEIPIALESPATISTASTTAGVVTVPSVTVLRFRNISRHAAHDWLGGGIAETVAADLETLGYVVERGESGPTVPVGTETQWLLTGGYQAVGSRIRITARLQDGMTGTVAETVTADGMLEDVFALQDRIVAALLPGGVESGPVAGTQPDAGGSLGTDRAPENRRSDVVRVRPNRNGAAPGRIILPSGDDVDARDFTRVRPLTGGGRGVSVPGPPATPTAGFAAGAGRLTGRPVVSAVEATGPPSIDGNLDDLVWRTATRITEFVQQSPIEGAPATEDTDVYIAFDSEHLYIGMHAHYSNPGMVRANRVDRDRAFFGDDTISIYFDPFLDQPRAFVFTLNGYGVQGDSLMGGGGSCRNCTGVPRGDRSWDALFDSSGRLVDDGWTAEMAIPFKSLRYPATDGTHRWGFQIARSIRDKTETVVWAPVSRDVAGFLPQMGLLDGLNGLSTSRNLEFQPTVTGIQAGSLDRSTGACNSEGQPEGGVNVKYGVTSNLTVDFTYNPDFSQIESDRPQIEVNQRFPLFFSELRPFFLEGQEIFDIRGPVNFIHTRTIVDPRYGGKLTGKVGNTTLGVLVANDEAPGKVDDPLDRGYGRTANTVIGRVRYDLYSESHIGAILTDRSFLDSYSRLAGMDSRFRVGQTTSIDFSALTTQNRDLDGNVASGPMFDGGYRHNGRNLSYSSSYYSIDPDFETDVGFVRRRNIRRIRSDVGYRWWPESWIINWGPEFDYSRNWNFDEILVDEEARVRLRTTFARNVSLRADVRREMERYGGINFDKTRYGFSGNVSTSRLFSVGANLNWGDQVRYGETPFLGEGSSGSLFMALRPFSRLQSSINVNTSRLLDPTFQSEVFDVKIYRALTTYQFTDRLLLRNILQHNSFSQTLGANILLTYRVNSGTVFFVGYDDRYQQGHLIFDDDDEPMFMATDFQRTNRAVFTKISYLFRY